MMKKTVIFALVLALLTASFPLFAAAEEATPPFDVAAKSAVLMDAETGTVLYEKNADEPLPPASVTKVMTLLLVMEAIEAGKATLSDMVCVSEKAASMGGSQIFLEPGEQMTMEDMLKSVIIASANDAALALAEHIAGSEEAFVDRMNARAAELGMKNTHFENTNGLDDDTENHIISARDIAIVSRELIRYPKILEYSGIWMDTVRNGEFGLTNTNRLIRFYSGATGLKTGSTHKAGFCISATAQRDGMHLIAVIMGSENRDTRNEAAKQLLDYGFANYGVFRTEESFLSDAAVIGGMASTCRVKRAPFSALLGKGESTRVSEEIVLPESVAAPISEGEAIGEVIYRVGEREIGRSAILAAESVRKIGFWDQFLRVLQLFALK